LANVHQDAEGHLTPADASADETAPIELSGQESFMDAPDAVFNPGVVHIGAPVGKRVTGKQSVLPPTGHFPVTWRYS
jgi:hypothetical protein